MPWQHNPPHHHHQLDPPHLKHCWYNNFNTFDIFAYLGHFYLKCNLPPTATVQDSNCCNQVYLCTLGPSFFQIYINIKNPTVVLQHPHRRDLVPTTDHMYCEVFPNVGCQNLNHQVAQWFNWTSFRLIAQSIEKYMTPNFPIYKNYIHITYLT